MLPSNPTLARCHAKTRSGRQCAHFPMAGQRVCHMHGGKAPQSLAKAEERMRDLVHPAISALRRQIDAGEFPATRYVLDWAGFKAAEKLEGSGEVTIRVEYADMVTEAKAVVDGEVLAVSYEGLPEPNGHSNGAAH